jgi:hypothetical protein
VDVADRVAADWDLDREWAAEAERVREAVVEAAQVGAAELEQAEVCGKQANQEHLAVGAQGAAVERVVEPEAVAVQEAARA